MTVRGWTQPRTPEGRSSLVVPPPWHYSGECLAVDFTADRDAIDALLPEGMIGDEDGAASFVIANWSSRADADERQKLDPAWSQYMEAFVILYGTFEGQRVGRVAYIWVDSELSLVRGLIQGYPKKGGTVAFSRPVEVGRGGPRKAAGEEFDGYVATHGHRLVTASVTLETPISDIPRAGATPLLHTRYWPSIDREDPAVDELSLAVVIDREFGSGLRGTATLSFEDSPFEELVALRPQSVGAGYIYSMANTIVGGKTVGQR